MSKIIYRKIRTAPGVKQYLDAEKTQVNPEFETSSSLSLSPRQPHSFLCSIFHQL